MDFFDFLFYRFELILYHFVGSDTYICGFSILWILYVFCACINTPMGPLQSGETMRPRLTRYLKTTGRPGARLKLNPGLLLRDYWKAWRKAQAQPWTAATRLTT